MQKWEYSIIVRVRGWKRGAVVVKDLNTYEADDWTNCYYYTSKETKQLGGNLLNTLTMLGEEGWELVSVYPRSDFLGGENSIPRDFAGFTSSEVWTFKRPKP